MAKDILINNETGVMIIVDDIREWRKELEAGDYIIVVSSRRRIKFIELSLDSSIEP